MEITNPLASPEKTNRSTTLIRLALIIGIIVIVLGVTAAIIQVTTGKRSLKSFLPKKLGGAAQPKVELQQEYQNPFKQDTQYVNPFEEAKNPLRNL